MTTSIYSINKGVNKAVEFKGLKAQYIWYLGGGLTLLLIVFAIMYFTGINSFVCLGITLIAGAGLFTWVYRLSNRYGEFGMMKKLAARHVPGLLKSKSRKVFFLSAHKRSDGRAEKFNGVKQ